MSRFGSTIPTMPEQEEFSPPLPPGFSPVGQADEEFSPPLPAGFSVMPSPLGPDRPSTVPTMGPIMSGLSFGMDPAWNKPPQIQPSFAPAGAAGPPVPPEIMGQQYVPPFQQADTSEAEFQLAGMAKIPQDIPPAQQVQLYQRYGPQRQRLQSQIESSKQQAVQDWLANLPTKPLHPSIRTADQQIAAIQAKSPVPLPVEVKADILRAFADREKIFVVMQKTGLGPMEAAEAAAKLETDQLTQTGIPAPDGRPAYRPDTMVGGDQFGLAEPAIPGGGQQVDPSNIRTAHASAIRRRYMAALVGVRPNDPALEEKLHLAQMQAAVPGESGGNWASIGGQNLAGKLAGAVGLIDPKTGAQIQEGAQAALGGGERWSPGGIAANIAAELGTSGPGMMSKAGTKLVPLIQGGIGAGQSRIQTGERRRTDPNISVGKEWADALTGAAIEYATERMGIEGSVAAGKSLGVRQAFAEAIASGRKGAIKDAANNVLKGFGKVTKAGLQEGPAEEGLAEIGQFIKDEALWGPDQKKRDRLGEDIIYSSIIGTGVGVGGAFIAPEGGQRELQGTSARAKASPADNERVVGSARGGDTTVVAGMDDARLAASGTSITVEGVQPAQAAAEAVTPNAPTLSEEDMDFLEFPLNQPKPNDLDLMLEESARVLGVPTEGRSVDEVWNDMRAAYRSARVVDETQQAPAQAPVGSEAGALVPEVQPPVEPQRPAAGAVTTPPEADQAGGQPAPAVSEPSIRHPGHDWPEREPIKVAPVAGKSSTLNLARPYRGSQGVTVTYRAAELSDIIPTHDARNNFAINPTGDINVRPYEDEKAGKPERQQVIERAKALNPGMIINTAPTAVDGPPVVTSDLRVLGGNSRTMILQRSYTDKSGNVGKQGMAYKKYLIEHAAEFGLDADAVSKMKSPVLVRVVEGDVGPRGEMSKVLNEAMTVQSTAAGDAVTRGRQIKPETVDQIAGIIGDRTIRETLDTADGNKILTELARSGAITENETSLMMDGDKLNAAGKEAIERALLGAVINDAGALAATPNSARQKIIKALPSLIRLKAAMPKGFPQTLASAVDLLGMKREFGDVSVKDMLSQQTLLRRPSMDHKQAVRLAEMLDEMGINDFAKKMREFAEGISDAVKGQSDLMLGRPKTTDEVVDEVLGQPSPPKEKPKNGKKAEAATAPEAQAKPVTSEEIDKAIGKPEEEGFADRAMKWGLDQMNKAGGIPADAKDFMGGPGKGGFSPIPQWMAGAVVWTVGKIAKTGKHFGKIAAAARAAFGSRIGPIFGKIFSMAKKFDMFKKKLAAKPPLVGGPATEVAAKKMQFEPKTIERELPKGSQRFKIGMFDRLRQFITSNHLRPIHKAFSAMDDPYNIIAEGLGGKADPFESGQLGMDSLQSTPGKVSFMFKEGVRNADFSFVLDPKTGEKLTVDHILDAIPDSARGEKGRPQQWLTNAMNLGIALRVIGKSRGLEMLTGWGKELHGITDRAAAQMVINEAKQDQADYDNKVEFMRRYGLVADWQLRYMLNKRLISTDQYRDMKKYPDYINMQRVLTRHGDGQTMGGFLQKFDGSEKMTRNPLANLMVSVARTVKIADTNWVWLKLLEGAEASGISEIATRVKEGEDDTDAITIKDRGEDVKVHYEKHIHNIIKQWGQAFPDQLAVIFKKLLGDGAVGRLVKWIDEISGGRVEYNPIKWPGRALHFGVKNTIGFAIRQFMLRDPISNLTRSSVGAKPWDILGRGAFGPIEAGRNIERYGFGQKYHGGQSIEAVYKQYIVPKIKEAEQNTSDIMVAAGKIFKSGVKLATGQPLWKAIDWLSDTLWRTPEYNKAYKKAKKAGLDEERAKYWAAWKAQQILSYDNVSTLMKYIQTTLYIPFATGAMANINKDLSMIADQRYGKKRTAAVAFRWMLYSALPAFAAWKWNHDQGEEVEEKFFKLSPWRRNFCYNFWVNDRFIFIPTTPLWGYLANSAVRAMEDVRGKHERPWEGVTQGAWSAIMPIDESVLAGPFRAIIENWANYKFFFGTPVVPPYEEERDLDLRPGTVDASKAGQVAQEWARKVGFSMDARKWDNLFRGVGGGMGELGMDVSDWASGRETAGRGKEAFFRHLTGNLYGGSAGYASPDVQYVLKKSTELGDTSNRDVEDLKEILRAASATKDNAQKEKWLSEARELAKMLRSQYDENEADIKADKLGKVEQARERRR